MADVKESLEQVSEYIGTQLKGSLDSKEEKFRVDTLPEPSAEETGKVYQYMGDSTVDLVHSFFYECVLGESGSYVWQIANVQPMADVTDKEEIFRYTELPTPAEELVGNPAVQYVGETTEDYTQNFYYECKPQGTDPETYAWEEAKVQSDPSISGISSTNIKSINAEFNSDYSLKRIYAIIDDGFEVQPFATISDVVFNETLKRYYNGDVTLAEIKEVWKVGDERDIVIPSILADANYAAQPSLTTKLKIVDFQHYNLTTAYQGKTQPLLVLRLKNTMTNAMLSATTNTTAKRGAGYTNWEIKSWLNNTFYNGVSDWLHDKIKSVTRTVDRGYDSLDTQNIQEVVFLPTQMEVFNARHQAYNGYSGRGGTQFTLYATQANRIADKEWMTCSCGQGGNYDAFTVYVNSSGVSTTSYNTGPFGILPHFCI